MNTEKIRTLDVLLEAMDIIENARSMEDLGPEERYELEKASLLLRNIERSIIRVKTSELVATLTEDADKLNELAEKIKLSAEKLTGISRAIEKAAKTVEAFVQIAAKSISAGLI